MNVIDIYARFLVLFPALFFFCCRDLLSVSAARFTRKAVPVFLFPDVEIMGIPSSNE